LIDWRVTPAKKTFVGLWINAGRQCYGWADGIAPGRFLAVLKMTGKFNCLKYRTKTRFGYIYYRTILS